MHANRWQLAIYMYILVLSCMLVQSCLLLLCVRVCCLRFVVVVRTCVLFAVAFIVCDLWSNNAHVCHTAVV